MAELKTKQTNDSVTAFVNNIDEETKREDCFVIINMMKNATGFPPKMWGTAIIGFGSYRYKYDSGHEGDMCMMVFRRVSRILLYMLA